MGFTKRILYQLVHQLRITNREAKQLLESGVVRVNGEVVRENVLIQDRDGLQVGDTEVRAPVKAVYLGFYKPRGYQSTLNKEVDHHLGAYFKSYKGLAIAGRLDKDSEGLLLLSNDGKWVERLCHPDNYKEKEYLVVVDRDIEEGWMELMQKGVMLGDGITRPCTCEALDKRRFKICLTEGRNRQIRRMCHKSHYKVLELKRIRIDRFSLGTMQAGDMRELDPDSGVWVSSPGVNGPATP